VISAKGSREAQKKSIGLSEGSRVEKNKDKKKKKKKRGETEAKFKEWDRETAS